MLRLRLVILACAIFTFTAAQARAAEHLHNGDMAIAGSTDVLAGIDAKGRPDGWFPSGHGDNTRYYIYGDWGQQQGPAKKMAKVKVSRHVSGNASWMSQDMPVTAGRTYVLTHRYRSDIPSTLGLRYLIGDAYTFRWLNTFPASDSWLPVPVRRRFTVPEGATRVAVYRAISSVGYLEIGDFSLVDPEDLAAPSAANLLRNGDLLEVDKNNEPVGWKHASTGGLYRGYAWQPCSVAQGAPLPANPRPCPHETGNHISLGKPGEEGEVEASWHTDEAALPSATGTAPRNLIVSYLVAAADEPLTRIRYTMADGSKLKKTIGIVNTEQEDLWGGPVRIETEVPPEAVLFSLFFTRRSSAFGSGRSKFADVRVRHVDPGVPIADPQL